MSHEIRTPLNAILGFSSFLKNKELAENRTEEFVDIIEASGRQLLSTINDILEISQIVAGQITVNNENVNISKLLNELFIQFNKEAAAKKLELVLNINNSAEDICTRTDSARIRQILSNLLINAIKFTHDGKIEFAARVANNQVIFYVKDTGIGIDPENQESIFEPFRQVEHSMSRNYGGNGLGLSISKALVECLGGKMSVNSVPNKGSTFTFMIPYITEKKDLSRHKVPGNGIYNWKDHVILVVEDEIYNFRYIEEIVLPTSAKVLHAKNGIEAVEMVKNHPEISVVLMDLKLPEMDGYKATELIKKMNPDLPVIAQTAFVSTSEAVAKEKNAHFDKYLSKPIEAKSFMEVIDNYLD
jgi:CheY-like chemotaxis protein/anti-sigma regulatory factor (Ser/Thr protein kinase)